MPDLRGDEVAKTLSSGSTIRQLVEEAAAELRGAGVSDAVRQARDLLQIATRLESAFIFAHPEFSPDESEISSFRDLVSRRSAREPLQQIRGRQEFFGLEYKVTRDVMIPRPETELIVEEGISLLSGVANPSVCEVGTGSGCIIVSLLHGMPDAIGIGLEKSPDALAITLENAVSNGVVERLELRESDVFGALKQGESFDLIVSNPPYVPLEDVSSLQPEVRDFEPQMALTDGGDGLGIVEQIVNEAPAFLKAGGHLLLEIGFSQSPAVLRMFDPGIWSKSGAFADLQGIPRMIRASLSAS